MSAAAANRRKKAAFERARLAAFDYSKKPRRGARASEQMALEQEKKKTRVFRAAREAQYFAITGRRFKAF